jgi:hypothetical protein
VTPSSWIIRTFQRISAWVSRRLALGPSGLPNSTFGSSVTIWPAVSNKICFSLIQASLVARLAAVTASPAWVALANSSSQRPR